MFYPLTSHNIYKPETGFWKVFFAAKNLSAGKEFSQV